MGKPFRENLVLTREEAQKLQNEVEAAKRNEFTKFDFKEFSTKLLSYKSVDLNDKLAINEIIEAIQVIFETDNYGDHETKAAPRTEILNLLDELKD